MLQVQTNKADRFKSFLPAHDLSNGLAFVVSHLFVNLQQKVQ